MKTLLSQISQILPRNSYLPFGVCCKISDFRVGLELCSILQKCHFRPRKAAEGAGRPPTAPRPPHTLCGHRRRRDTSPRGSAERSAPSPALRRAPRSGLGEFWRVSNILYRISWCVFGARSNVIPAREVVFAPFRILFKLPSPDLNPNRFALRGDRVTELLLRRVAMKTGGTSR